MLITITLSVLPETPVGIVYCPETGTDNTGIGLQSEIIGVKNTVAKQLSHAAIGREPTEEIDYPQLATEHAELIRQGTTSIKIAQWIGNKLNIPSWEAGDFFGERKVLSSPKTLEEIQRLRTFVGRLGISFGPANQASENHSQYLLLDGCVQNALFGEHNMSRVESKLRRLNREWEELGDDYTAKAKYLHEKIGLDIKGDWSKLTGTRLITGNFADSDGLYASGPFARNMLVKILRLFKSSSDSGLFDDAFVARLCFLA